MRKVINRHIFAYICVNSRFDSIPVSNDFTRTSKSIPQLKVGVAEVMIGEGEKTREYEEGGKPWIWVVLRERERRGMRDG